MRVDAGSGAFRVRSTDLAVLAVALDRTTEDVVKLIDELGRTP
jgi:hypothetical protein